MRKGGWVLALYGHSLAIAFVALFFASAALHAIGGVKAVNEEQVQHGEAAISVWRYLTTSQFWFESMQNWQSELIAVAIVGLLVFYVSVDPLNRSRSLSHTVTPAPKARHW